MPQIFNPPPNWPQPPVNWSPPRDWRPDPSWGPAPVGWRLWVEKDDKSEASVRVFINYRRSDAQSQANGLYDGLSHRLPQASIFMDIDSIPVGADFEHYIRREIEVCDVVLVLIGDDWLAKRAGSETRRIDESGDFVRLEIESALASPRVRTVPVLIEDAQMPSVADLPPSLKRLARLNAIELNDRRWKSDLERLTAFLRGAVEEERVAARNEYSPQSGVTSGANLAPKPPDTRPVTATAPKYLPAPPPPPGRPSGWRSNGAGLLIAWLPLLTLGLASFAPFLRAVLLHPDDKTLRKRLVLWGAGLELLALVGFAIVGSAPTDGTGTPTGAASNVGTAALFAAIIPAIVWGFVYRRAPDRG